MVYPVPRNAYREIVLTHLHLLRFKQSSGLSHLRVVRNDPIFIYKATRKKQTILVFQNLSKYVVFMGNLGITPLQVLVYMNLMISV